MKAAYVFFARNKARHVRQSFSAALEQDCPGLEILVAEGRSTDGTREIIEGMLDDYRGPHQVRILDCPDQGLAGHAAFNADCAWVHEQTDAEVMVFASADDLARSQHARVLVDALERSGADMAGTPYLFARPGEEPHERNPWDREGRVLAYELVKHRIGGCSALAWRRTFWEAVEGLPPFVSLDVYLPPLAAALNGFWFVNQPSYVYVQHADDGNLGFEGRINGSHEKMPLIEHAHFHLANSYYGALARMQELDVGASTDHDALAGAAWEQFGHWLNTRGQMSMQRIAPQPFMA